MKNNLNNLQNYLIVIGYIIYKIEEKIELLIYKIKRSKEEKNLMKKYINQIRRRA